MSYETNKPGCNDDKLQYDVYSACIKINGNQAALQSTHIHGELRFEQEKNNKKNRKIQQRRGTKAHIWDDIK